MYSIVRYFTQQQNMLSLLFVIMQNIVNHYILLNIQFYLFDIKIPIKSHLLCALGISLIYLFPLYAVDFLFFSPGVFFSVWLYTMLMFINPVSSIAYYFVIKRTLKLSPTKNSIILKNHLLMHYVVVLIYMLQNNVLYDIVPNIMIVKNLFFHEFISIILIIVVLVICQIMVKLYLGKTKKYITIPANYYEKNVGYNLLKTHFVLTIFYAIIVFFRVKWLSSNLESFDPTVSFIYFLLIACVLFYIVISITSLRTKLLEWEIQATGTYTSSLLNANQGFREIKHDFYNVLQTYGGYLEIEDYAGLKSYHKSLFKTTKMAGDFLSLIEALKSRIAVYHLLKSKVEYANELGVSFSINMMCDISDVVLTDIDLCRVLGIVIDNAIEESCVSLHKQINLSFERKDPVTIIFAISNTTRGYVDIEKIFDKGYSTKENHSGIGLPQVLHILNSYDHCKARVNYHEKQFTIFLIVSADSDEKLVRKN